MSGRRPIERLTAKNKKTGEITELLAVWPPREAGYPKGITVNKDLTVAQIAEMLKSGGKDGDFFLDLRDNAPRAERQDF